MPLEKKWILKPEKNPQAIEHLMKELNVEYLIAKLLVDRGIETFDQAKDFFRPNLNQLHDPYLMRNMQSAVDRINLAIENGEGILIYGDYDVDGTTSVALMYSFLKQRYPHLETYIPDRYKEGYGVSFAGIDFAAEQGLSLIIALDCGIKAIDKVQYAKEKGIDFIICDHHRPGDKVPNAVAVLDPKQEDCQYPYDELSGCGVGFKLCQALAQNWKWSEDSWLSTLDLLALSIGADIVPITGENRILAFHGLKKINKDPRPGMKAMIETAKKSGNLTITDVVFTIGPRVNAAGRMDHGHKAVELLCTENYDDALKLAENIEVNNRDRRAVEADILDAAVKQLDTPEEQKRKSTVIYNPEWNKGVIGIVASKLIEKHYYRPTVVFTKSGDKLAASARSVMGFDIYQALDKCSDVLEQFGGHMYAAGMTLKEERFEEFKEKFEQVVSESITEDQLKPFIEVDAEVRLEDITDKTFRILSQFEPFGPQNLQPIFAAKCLRDNGSGRQIGADKSHLKLCLRDADGSKTFDTIAFGFGELWTDLAGKEVHACFHIDENIWNGRRSLQLRALDIKQAILA